MSMPTLPTNYFFHFYANADYWENDDERSVPAPVHNYVKHCPIDDDDAADDDDDNHHDRGRHPYEEYCRHTIDGHRIVHDRHHYVHYRPTDLPNQILLQIVDCICARNFKLNFKILFSAQSHPLQLRIETII